MNPHERTDCVDLLLAIVFYETYCRQLSPEMAYLLQKHLDACSSCRARMLVFQRILGGRVKRRSFG